MWVNNELIASAGIVGTNREKMTPQYLPQTAFFQSKEKIEIILQISNFYHRSGGLLESIKLGQKEAILDMNNKRLAYDLFLFGSLLIMGIYHVFVFIYRKKERSILYFGLFCLFVSIRTLLVGEIFFIHLFPNFSWELAHKMQTSSYYLGVFLLIMFFKTIFPEYIKKGIIRGFTFIISGFALIVLLTPARIFTLFNPLYQVFTLVVISYIILVLYKILRYKVIKEKDISSLFIVTGALILFITVLNDIYFSVS